MLHFLVRFFLSSLRIKCSPIFLYAWRLFLDLLFSKYMFQVLQKKKINKYIAFILYRILRQKICNARVREQNTKSGKSASNERPGMYDTVGDNSGYQELGYVSGPSHYERL